MFKLSTKGRYGARLMMELAKRYDGTFVLLKDVAKEQDISRRYLEHIVVPIKKAGLIRSERGAHGGYILSREPSLITLEEVISAVEGPLVPVDCVAMPEICHKVDDCVTRRIWKKLGKTIRQTLAEITLADMVKMGKKEKREIN